MRKADFYTLLIFILIVAELVFSFAATASTETKRRRRTLVAVVDMPHASTAGVRSHSQEYAKLKNLSKFFRHISELTLKM